jgi:hypothetical protein
MSNRSTRNRPVATALAALAAAWVLAGPAALAESTFHLTVKDREGSDPIAKATARLQRKDAQATEVKSDDAGLIELGPLKDGTYSLTVIATGYGPYRATLKVPAEKTAIEVLLRRLRTLKVTVGAGGKKLPANVITVKVLQASGSGEPHSSEGKVSAKGVASCTGVLDGPACLMAMYRGCVAYAGRIKVDGDGQETIELDPGFSPIAVKGKVHGPKELPVSQVLFVRADSRTPGGVAQVVKSSYKTSLVAGKYDAYAKCAMGCFSLGPVDVGGGPPKPGGPAPTQIDLTLDLARAPTAESELAIIGLADRAATAVPVSAVAPGPGNPAVAMGQPGPRNQPARGRQPPPAAQPTGSAEDQIRFSIPETTAMTQEDFDILFDRKPKQTVFEPKQTSLTLQILGLPPAADVSPEARDEFELLVSDPGVAVLEKIRDEMAPPLPLRVRRYFPNYVAPGPRSMIRANRIKEFTCEVNGDTATGTVTFEVPKLYRGKFNYAAKRVGRRWQITELAMPARKIDLLWEAGG